MGAQKKREWKSNYIKSIPPGIHTRSHADYAKIREVREAVQALGFPAPLSQRPDDCPRVRRGNKDDAEDLLISTVNATDWEWVLGKYQLQGDEYAFRPEPCDRATDAQPGSVEKICELARRMEEGVELWHEGDKVAHRTYGEYTEGVGRLLERVFQPTYSEALDDCEDEGPLLD